jgi:hypothetical protein
MDKWLDMSWTWLCWLCLFNLQLAEANRISLIPYSEKEKKTERFKL